MGLRFIYGTAGTGKSSFCFEEIKNIKWVDLNQAFDIITYENTKDLYKEVLKDIN